MSILKPIEKKTIVERIVQQITDAILAGELKPGDKIPTEAELIERLGVGRNSVREAIKMLSALGVLEIRRGDGTYITEKITPTIFDSLVYSLIIEQSTPDELLELRKTLEVDVLELAVEKATDEDTKRLEKLLEEFHQVFKQRDYDKAAELDLQFHYTIVDIARNPLLARIVKAVLDLFYYSVRRTLQAYQASKDGTHESHRMMVEIIKNKDKDKIPQVVEDSLRGWKHFVKTSNPR